MAKEKHIFEELLDAVAPDLGAMLAEAPADDPVGVRESVAPAPEPYKSPELAALMTNQVDRIVEAIDGHVDESKSFPLGTPAIHRSEWKRRRALELGEIKSTP